VVSVGKVARDVSLTNRDIRQLRELARAILPLMRRNFLARFIWAFVEWLDVGVLVLLLVWGAALLVVLVVGGGTAIQMALVVVLVAAMALNWVLTSPAGEKLRGRRR
jgi:hypothetical protein